MRFKRNRTGLERFRAKWTPVRVKKTRQNKGFERGSDSIRTDKALVLRWPDSAYEGPIEIEAVLEDPVILIAQFGACPLA